eukprot:c11214_g1_i3.p1 GENE.c11214_g1_i3~~c11214_g1_i3.p1  ORF type:complete len:497 (-),score=117.50 c11214_g1_i3:153-1643(-)
MRAVLGAVVVIWSLGCTSTAAQLNESFVEQLSISSFPKAATFDFVFDRKLQSGETTPTQFGLFPRRMVKILTEYKVQKMKLVLARGQSDPRLFYSPSPSGGRFQASFLTSNKTEGENLWQMLIGAMGGLFCSSLSSLLLPHAFTVPLLSSLHSSEYGRIGFLPDETICAENLSPFLSLLPCPQTGIASFLTPDFVFSTDYHAMEIEATTSPAGNALEQSLQLKMSVHVIGATDLPIAQQMHKIAQQQPSHMRACSLAASSRITCEGHCPDALNMDQVTIEAVTLSKSPDPFPINILRHHTSSSSGGTPSGTAHFTINNNNWQPAKIEWTEYLPWFIDPQLHSLTASPHIDAIRQVSLTHDSHNDMQLFRMSCEVPGHSVTQITYSYLKGYVTWSQHPPDPARGFSIPPLEARITVGTFSATVHSPSLLVLVPTPDFSMPFNALCIVCTVVTFFVGSSLAILSRDWDAHLADDRLRLTQGSPLVRTLNKIFQKLKRE